MLIWTIQDANTWFDKQYNQMHGFYYALWNQEGSFENENDEIGAKAYMWLREQLPKRIENYSDFAPIWAHVYPINVRQRMKGLWKDNKSKWIIIKADVDPKRCLISCYSRWHNCLNNSPVIEYVEYEDGTDSFDRYEGDIRNSWHNIFDVDSQEEWVKKEHGFDAKKLQVCIDRLYSQEILSVHRIVGRKRRKL